MNYPVFPKVEISSAGPGIARGCPSLEPLMLRQLALPVTSTTITPDQLSDDSSMLMVDLNIKHTHAVVLNFNHLMI